MTHPRAHRLALSAVAVATAAALLASGCSSTSGDAPQHGDTYSWLTSRSANDATVKAVSDIAAEYAKTDEGKGFKLDVQSISDRPSYLQKIKVLASSNDLPDLFDADPEPYFRDIVKSGVIADIGAFYDEAGLTDKFFPISLDYARWDDGSLNLITLQANSEYFFYNKDLFAKAGVEPPTTLDDLVTVMAKLKATGITPMAIDGKDGWPYYRFLAMPAFRETGNTFLDDLATGKASLTDPVGQRSIEYLQKLAPYFQDGATSTDYTTSLNLFLSGDAAMLYNGTWEIPSFIDNAGELKSNIGIFTMPKESDSDKTAPADFFANSGIGTAIRKDALTPELKGFLNYFFAHYADTAFYDYHIIPSLRPEMRPEISSLYQRILDDIAGVKTFAKVWDVQLDANTVTTLSRESDGLILGSTSPQAFAEAADSSIADYLKQQN